MQWTSVALILCSVAALGWTCCTPDAWEGVQTQTSGYAGFLHHGLIKEYNDVAYDANNSRSAVFLRYVNGHVEAKIKIVVRYDDDDGEGMLYVDNYNRRRCWKKRLDRKFRKACIPDDAKPAGEFSLGLAGDYKLKGYFFKSKHLDTYVSVQPVEEGVCAPVGELSTGRVGHFDILRNVAFIDITPGIKNETVFDVPKDCNDDWQDFDLPIDIDRQDFVLGL